MELEGSDRNDDEESSSSCSSCSSSSEEELELFGDNDADENSDAEEDENEGSMAENSKDGRSSKLVSTLKSIFGHDSKQTSRCTRIATSGMHTYIPESMDQTEQHLRWSIGLHRPVTHCISNREARCSGASR
jgi:hypothetical protein